MKNIYKINKVKYDQEGSYNYLANKWHKRRIDKALGFIGSFKNKKKIKLVGLDIGCGDGKVTEKIMQLGIEMYGIDITTEQLKKAELKGIKVIEGDIQGQLPFQDKFFDIVFAGEIIEHIADPREFIIEINRVLKIGGIFVLTTPNLAGFDNRMKLLFGKIPRCIEPLSSHHYQHVRPFTYCSLKEFLERGGFKITSFTSNRIKFNLFGLLKIDSYLLADIFPGFGATLIVCAEKDEDVDVINLNEE